MPSGYVPTTAEEKADAEAATEAAKRRGGNIIDAAIDGNLPAVRHIVRSDAEAVHQKSSIGSTALMLAADRGHLSIAQFLVKEKADVNAKRSDGDTALICAARNGHLSIAQLLVQSKADVNAKDNYGSTALIYAARNVHLSIAQFLVKEKADVNAEKNDGGTPLTNAAYNGHLSMAQFLVESKADVTAKKNDGETALDRARANGKTDVVAFLERAAKEEDSKAKDTTHLEAELAATKAELERMQLTAAAASPSSSGGYAGQASPVSPAPKASSGTAEARRVNVRSTHWYPFYRHTVFQTIQSCFADDYAEGVVLIGIQPDLDRTMTCAEWPSIQEDLFQPFDEKKHPFYQKGEKKLDFAKITFKRVELQDLGDEINLSTKRNKFAVIASCCESDFHAADEAIEKHNKATPAGHGKVRRAWATSEDVYGRGSHP